jgi:hypothetical protein
VYDCVIVPLLLTARPPPFPRKLPGPAEPVKNDWMIVPLLVTARPPAASYPETATLLEERSMVPSFCATEPPASPKKPLQNYAKGLLTFSTRC